MHTALSLAVKIRGVSTLIIGTSECGYYSRSVPLSSPYGDEAFHWNYVLDSKEVVFGFRKGLMKAIAEMDKAGARLILLLATCVPELIGEDIESICHASNFQDEEQFQMKATIFKNSAYTTDRESGWWSFLRAAPCGANGVPIRNSGAPYPDPLEP